MDIINVIENNPVPWTVAKFAAAMGVSTDHVYDQIKAGRLPAIKLGSKFLLDPKRTADCLRQKKLTVTIEVPQLRIPRRAARMRRAS